MTAVRVHSPWLVLLAAAVGLPLAAQEPATEGTPVEIGQRFTLHSEILGEDRPVLVGLPAGYDESDEPYPVLYLLDGGAHFHHTTGTVRFLAENNRMPAAIVVAIPNLSGEGRTRDLTPPLEDEKSRTEFPTAGGAGDFLRFLTEELRPWVDARWRTRDFEILVGHSFGGLFVTEVLNRDPSAFDAYLSISPSLWWDEGAYLDRIADLFERHPEARGSLYMTMANEGTNMLGGALVFAGTLSSHAPGSFRWHWRHMPTESHGTIPARTIYDGLEWTFEGWDPMPLLMSIALDGDPAAPAMEALDAHYRGLSERMAWEVRPPADLFWNVGSYLLDEGRPEDGVAVFTALVRWYPDHSSSHRGLATALTADCRFDEARSHYGHALARAEASEDESGVAAVREGLTALDEAAAAGSSCGGDPAGLSLR
ncbi:MAG TPA: alpha/beta hydrolase-fold protein [Longimicrobiales bacterium]|nr:alpha/beta hydrolase-fold protein [Longimicrobiales bacterium]